MKYKKLDFKSVSESFHPLVKKKLYSTYLIWQSKTVENYKNEFILCKSLQLLLLLLVCSKDKIA